MDSTRDILLNLYLDVEDMSNEEVNAYLVKMGKDPAKIKADAENLIKKLRAKNKINKGKNYIELFKQIMEQINKGFNIPNMEEGLQADIQFQYNKLKSTNEEDFFELMEDATKLKLMRYLKERGRVAGGK
ncbi:MAG: hypothetical protein H6609_18955 [Ignavibacteriales bacterium]|nr:hypothetical protein [Ignavibacteriales bacterium]